MPLPEHPAPPVTLSELQRRIVEDLHLRLGDSDRPVTLQPGRASRDITDWAALATYGHPELEVALDRVTQAFDPDRSPVVFAERGGIVEAVRADRSPPEPIRTVHDLDNLGDPYARGDAASAAAERAAELASERHQRYDATLALRAEDWQADLRRRFARLASAAVATQCGLVEQLSLDETDPGDAWHELGRRDDGWRYAEAFRRRLGLGIADLLPARPVINAARERPRSDLEQDLRDTGAKILELMRQWRARSV